MKLSLAPWHRRPVLAAAGAVAVALAAAFGTAADNMTGQVDTSGNLWTNRDYRQLVSAAGANAAPGSNGCVYPSSVQTLFNQLDAAHVSWKGTRRISATPTPAAAPTTPAPSTAAHRMPRRAPAHAAPRD